MLTSSPEIDREAVEHRAQAHYWRAMHTRACERESFWKEKAQQLGITNRQQEAQINQLLQEREKLKARVAWLGSSCLAENRRR